MRDRGLSVATVAVLAAVLSATLVSVDGEPAGAQSRVAPAFLSVQGPWSVGGVRVGVAAGVVVDVIAGAPLRSIELLDGDLTVATVKVSKRRVTQSFSWAPTVAGQRPLIARVRDRAGRVAQSFPRWVSVAPATGAVRAARAVSSPVAVTVASNPPAPKVTVDPNACAATISVSAKGPTLVFAATPGSGGFLPLGSLAGGGDQLVIPTGAGAIAVFGAPPGGGVGSLPTVVEAPESCAAKHWQGDAWIANGIVHTNVAAAAAYLYLSIDDSPWARIPAVDQTFVPAGPTPTTFDFSGTLPSLAGQKIEMEVWGRVGGSAQQLGTGTFNPPTAVDQLPSSVGTLVLNPYLKADLDWIQVPASKQTGQAEVLARIGTLKPYEWKKSVVKSQPGSSGPGITIQADDGVRAFRWAAKQADVNGGIWQVSTLPPPDSPDLTFPGLRSFKPIVGNAGTFAIDFKKLLTGTEVVNVPEPESIAYEQLVAAALPGAAAAKKLTKPVQTGSAPATDKAQALWVRVVPTKDGQPVDATSNVVAFDVVWFDVAKAAKAVVGTFADAFSATYTITPPSLPNADYGHCVRVVENPFSGNSPALGGSNPSPLGFANQFNYKPAPVGTTVCPEYTPPDDDWWDYFVSFVEGVAEFYNVVATFVNDLKANIISKFAMYGGCSGVLGADFCEGVLTAAVDVFLAANGIPPTVPTTPDLKADLEDQLADFAAEQVASQCPKGLDDACKEQAKKAAAELIDKVEEQVSETAFDAAQSGDYTLYLNPAIKVIPEPAGQLTPAIVTVKLTKSSPPYKKQPPPACAVKAFSTGENPSYKWYGKKTVKGSVELRTGPLYGSPFTGVTKSVPVDQMKPGETATVVLSVGPVQEVWAEGKSPIYGWWGQKPDTGGFFLDGAKVTISWTSDCATGGGATFAQSGDVGDTKPAEIVYP